MVSDVFLQFLFGSGCIVFGYVAGLATSWREYRVGSRRIVAPTPPRTEQDRAYWYVAVAVLAVVSTTFAGIQTARQAKFVQEQQACNIEFRASLIARSAISDANSDRFNSMIGVIADSISNPQPDSRDRTRQAILEYREWSVEVKQRRAENPISDPKCGSK